MMKHTLANFCMAIAIATTSPATAGAFRTATATSIDVTVQYASKDFSSLLMPRTPILGFAGDNYQRLRVALLSVLPDPAVPGQYKAVGYTLYKGRQTPFAGTITTLKISRLPDFNTGVDDDMKGRVRDEGILFGNYIFLEADDTTLTGTIELDWYADTKNRLVYDDINRASDNYCNNQYTGTWTLPTGTVTANFGEYRIPQSGDLDVGAAEFHAAAKYAAFGWAAEAAN